MSYQQQRQDLVESSWRLKKKVSAHLWGYDSAWAHIDESRENGNGGRSETACEVLALSDRSANASSALVRQTL